MVSLDEARRTRDCGDHYVISPEIAWAGRGAPSGTPVPEGFRYASDRNDEWLDRGSLAALLDA
jgi:hypothetical protein